MTRSDWGPLVVVLLLAVIAWFALANIARYARTEGSTGSELTVADYDQGKDWAADLLGLAATLAGFLGVAAAGRLQNESRRGAAEKGLVSILAGTTLLGVGGWLAPAGLAAFAAGAAADRVATTLRIEGRNRVPATGAVTDLT